MVQGDEKSDVNDTKEFTDTVDDFIQQVCSGAHDCEPCKCGSCDHKSYVKIIGMQDVELTEFEKRVYDFIAADEGVTCVALSRLFGEGHKSLIWNKVRNIEIAFGMGEELAEATAKLWDSGCIVEVPCDVERFFIDGGISLHPLARVNNLGDEGFEELHWLPVYFATYENAIKLMEEMFAEEPDNLVMVVNSLKVRQALARKSFMERQAVAKTDAGSDKE